MPTTSKGFPYPSSGDVPNVPSDIQSLASSVDTYLDNKSNLESPTFTGTPSAPTASAGTNTTQIATTEFVRSEVSNLVASAPATLDTLDELAAALGDDANFATTVTNSLSGKLNTSGGTISGSLVVSGTLDANEIRESVVDVTLASNVGTLDWTAGNIYYIATAPTAAMTFNVTNAPTDNSKMMTINVFVTQGSTGYIPTTFQIGGASQTIRWPGGTAPTPTSSAGKIDIFSFTMHRTSAGSWIVYGGSSLNF
jgi:hypothetical protein